MKKPSNICLAIAKEADWVSSSFYMMICGIVYAFDPKLVKRFNETVDNEARVHETIHVRQAQGIHNSWFLFYLRYFWEWLCNISLITVNSKAPYMFMPMEIEAYGNEDIPDYIQHGACEAWRSIEDVPKKELKKLAKQWYDKDNNKMTFNKFLKKYFDF